MQSRRHEEFGIPSPNGRDRQTDFRQDHLCSSRPRRSVSPLTRPRRSVSPLTRPRRSVSPLTRPRRSVSPRIRERMLGADGRRDSFERRDYGWDMGGNRGDRLLSRSPPLGELKRGPRYDHDHGVISKNFPPLEVQGRYDFIDHMGMDMNRDVDSGRRNDHDYYKHSDSRAMREDFDGRRFDGGRHGMVGQNSMASEDGPGRGTYKLALDVGPTSKYDERGGSFTSVSASMDFGLRRDERVRYPDPFPVDKLSSREPYRKEEKSIFHFRDDPYSVATASKSKDFMGSPRLKDVAGTSYGNLRGNFPSSYRGGVPLPDEDYPRSSMTITEPLGYPEYEPRQIVGTRRDPDLEVKNDLVQYGRDTFSPTRSQNRDYLHRKPVVRETDDYIHRKPIVRETDDYVHPSDKIYGRMDTRERLDYSHGDVLRPSMVDSVTDRFDNTEYSHGNPSNISLWDHHSHEKKTVSNHIGLSRASATLKQGGQYLDSTGGHFELGRKISREQEMLYMDMSRDREISHTRTSSDSKRDVAPEPYKERMRNSPDIPYDIERHRLPERRRLIEDESLGNYDSPNRVMKRKYRTDEEISRHTSRSIMPSEWNSSVRRNVVHVDDEWTSADATRPFLSRRGGYAHGLDRRLEREYDGDYDEDYTSEDWVSSHDQEEHLQDYPTKSYKYGTKYSKGHPKGGSLNLYHSNHPSTKHVLPKWKNVWMRGKDDNDVDNVYAAEIVRSKEWGSSEKSEPPEDSEEFQQLVHKFFLSFSKKLNDHPGVRKRYQEHGRAGSLFCIVCGRSLSKEFLDTQRLATHAFMSHKVGLRAQHMALLKAICVLLGWNTALVPDTITWFPDPLSSAEAWAQKEDLIIWPPVIVIHNTSISYNDSEGQGIITIEALEDFLRGKGFSGGKIRIGKYSNHSIMLVKYLGTFSGLQDAEKLHKYLANNKHGRKEVNEIAYNEGKNSNGGEGEMKKDGVNEIFMYGYMGIAEDLDKVDFDTKRKCLIKSKKEIQDLVDAPVKPE